MISAATKMDKPTLQSEDPEHKLYGPAEVMKKLKVHWGLHQKDANSIWRPLNMEVLFGTSVGEFAPQITSAMLVPFFSLAVQENFGWNTKDIGITHTVFGACQVIGSLTMVGLLERFGMLRSMGLGVVLVGVAGFSTGFQTSVLMVSILAGLRAFAEVASRVGSSHLIVEEFPNNLGPAIGFREATGGIASAVGPLMGGVLFMIGGFKLPFIVVGIATIIMGLLIWVILPPLIAKKNFGNQSKVASQDGLVKHDETSASMDKVTLKDLCNVHVIVGVGALGALNAAMLGIVNPFLALHLFRTLNMSTSTIGLVMAIQAILQAGSSLLGGYIMNHPLMPKFVVALGLAVISACICICSSVPYLHFPSYEVQVTIVTASVLVWGIGTGLCLPAFFSVIQSGIPNRSDSGAVVGCLILMTKGMRMTALFAGWLADDVLPRSSANCAFAEDDPNFVYCDSALPLMYLFAGVSVGVLSMATAILIPAVKEPSDMKTIASVSQMPYTEGPEVVVDQCENQRCAK